MTEKIEKTAEVYELLAGTSEQTAEVVAKGTKTEMNKAAKELFEVYTANKVSLFAQVVKA